MREYFTAIGIKGQKGGRSTSGQFPSLIQVYYRCMVLGVAKKQARNTPIHVEGHGEVMGGFYQSK